MLDATSHPDFASGPITFGLYQILGPVPADNSATILYDNFNLTIHTAAVATPEPLTLSLFGAGLVGAAALRRRAKRKA